MSKQLHSNIVEYIELTDQVIGEMKAQLKFSDEALEKAAAALADSAIIKAEEREELVEMFRTDPDKALESLSKVASSVRQAPSDYSLGSPGEGQPRKHMKESDRVLYEKLGLT